MKLKAKGFTLIEVIAAAIISAFVAITAMAAMRTIAAGRNKAADIMAVTDQLRFACNIIRNDCGNIYRDSKKNGRRFAGELMGSESGEYLIPSLTMHIISRSKARAQEPESDVYEVQYYLLMDEEKKTSMLVRRICPKLAGIEDAEPGYGSGGILTVIAENVIQFSILYYDGENWIPEWPVELQNLPDLLDVQIACIGLDGKSKIEKDFFVSLSK